ncbi:MAG TPA: hypothetical protein VMK32_05280 [Burkholderiaceae bacterium]|nr:hypothetical protein [Burkholderiaceae bacterium]
MRFYGVRLARLQVDKVARPNRYRPVVENQPHATADSEQRDFPRRGVPGHARSGRQRQPDHFKALGLQHSAGAGRPVGQKVHYLTTVSMRLGHG